MHVYTHTNITYYMYVCSKLTLFHLSSKPVLHYFDLYNLFHLRIQWHQCILLLYTHKHTLTHSLTHTHSLITMSNLQSLSSSHLIVLFHLMSSGIPDGPK